MLVLCVIYKYRVFKYAFEWQIFILKPREPVVSEILQKLYKLLTFPGIKK